MISLKCFIGHTLRPYTDLHVTEFYLTGMDYLIRFPSPVIALRRLDAKINL